MKATKKIILILFLSCMFVSSEAYAKTKLDFFEPVYDFMLKVQKAKQQIEEEYAKIMQQMNEKVHKALGAEGAALFQVIVRHGQGIVARAVTGQLSRDDLSLSHMVDAMKSQLGNYKLDLATLMMLRHDYKAALSRERFAKAAAMNEELARLMAEREALNKALSESSVSGDMDKIKDLQDEADNLATDYAALKSRVTTYKKQIKKAQETNAKFEEYIRRIETSLGDNMTDSDREDVANYREAIETNNRSIAKWEEALAAFDDIPAQMAEVQTARKTLNDSMMASVTDGDLKAQLAHLDELDRAIASLKGEMVRNAESVAQKVAFEDKLRDINDKINMAAVQLSADNLVRNMDIAVFSFFDRIDEKESNNRYLYDEGITKFFLGEDETQNPKTIAQVTKERRVEFYNAYKNMLEVLMKSYGKTAETGEVSVSCTEASTNMADSVLGADSMRVCNDIQKAKAAIQYAELLLGQLRLDAAADFQGMSDRYKMDDYDHDMTELDLDAYIMGAKSKTKSLLKQAKAKAKAAVKQAAEKEIEKAQNELHEKVEDAMYNTSSGGL